MTPEDDPSRRSAGWYVHHFIGSAFQLGAMATTYYASRTEPLSMDAHTNVSWALLFVAVIVIPGLLTFAESFVKPDGSGQDAVTAVTLMLGLGGITAMGVLAATPIVTTPIPFSTLLPVSLALTILAPYSLPGSNPRADSMFAETHYGAWSSRWVAPVVCLMLWIVGLAG
ncbi:hypothetical protein HMPREF9153_0384 [Cutibacterium avidum ATCC 25577]|uniref:Uncharacterized protein n=2 Tax=Cutibacterium avidum TaxID=33010 RepID=G4CV27_9ACTN|nr:hypothetical protein HMPREF9153_0384 [Cutibacterium avidum ATCC 25577]